MITNSRVVMGVLAGVAAGALIGIAVAPKKSKAQKQLTQKGEDLADALQSAIDKKFEDLLEQIEEKLSNQRVKEA